jgi:hypothetical protein
LAFHPALVGHFFQPVHLIALSGGGKQWINGGGVIGTNGDQIGAWQGSNEEAKQGLDRESMEDQSHERKISIKINTLLIRRRDNMLKKIPTI